MSQDPADLPEIPDLPDLPELPEIPELSDVPPAASPASPVASAKAVVAASLEELPETPAEPPQNNPNIPTLGPDGKPPLRELEEAPRQLGTAALIAAAGGALPWIGANPEAPIADWIVPLLVAKLLVGLGAWMWWMQIQHNWGPQLTGIFGTLGNLSLGGKAKDEKKAPRKSVRDAPPVTLTHPFPTGLHILSLVLALVGAVVLPLVWPMGHAGKIMAELGMFGWALFTWVHIRSYERWGSFNPIFPLMFLAMFAAGAASVIFTLTTGGLKTQSGLFGVVGGLIVAIGGGMAAYTMYLSLKQAKVEGDLKKQAASEARKAARSSRRS